MVRRKPEDIVRLVDAHYTATEPLSQRMQDDHSLYRLDPYDAGEGYQSYTSNEPHTYAQKVIGWIKKIKNICPIKIIRFFCLLQIEKKFMRKLIKDLFKLDIKVALNRFPEIFLNILDLLKGDQLNVIGIKK